MSNLNTDLIVSGILDDVNLIIPEGSEIIKTTYNITKEKNDYSCKIYIEYIKNGVHCNIEYVGDKNSTQISHDMWDTSKGSCSVDTHLQAMRYRDENYNGNKIYILLQNKKLPHQIQLHKMRLNNKYNIPEDWKVIETFKYIEGNLFK